MDTEGFGGVNGEEKHVAFADQVFGADGIEDSAGVDSGTDGEGDAAANVVLDRSGDDVHAGALGGNDEVDSGRPGKLGEAGDTCFDLVSALDHEIGEFVNDDNEVGKAVGKRGFGVPAINIADSGFGKLIVAAVHFSDNSAKDSGGFFDIFDDGAHEVRETFEKGELNPLGVNHDHSEIFGGHAQDERHDDGGETD